MGGDGRIWVIPTSPTVLAGLIMDNLPEDIRLINVKLGDVYGTDFLNRPNFRLVWSPDMVEKRVGNWTDWYMQTIFIRQWYGVREVKKYPIGQ